MRGIKGRRIMKIKHWQGYGTVNAEKIYKQSNEGETVLKVKVTGNHEWGLVRDDEYDLINWLVKRFDKQFEGDRVKYTYESGYARKGNIDEEYCIYTFVY